MRNGSDPHVREEFRSRGGGGLKSLARIFSPSLFTRKSSGFARILPAFLPEIVIFEKFGGGGVAAPP